jgi:hypothetical protein
MRARHGPRRYWLGPGTLGPLALVWVLSGQPHGPVGVLQAKERARRPSLSMLWRFSRVVAELPQNPCMRNNLFFPGHPTGGGALLSAHSRRTSCSSHNNLRMNLLA